MDYFFYSLSFVVIGIRSVLVRCECKPFYMETREKKIIAIEPIKLFVSCAQIKLNEMNSSCDAVSFNIRCNKSMVKVKRRWKNQVIKFTSYAFWCASLVFQLDHLIDSHRFECLCAFLLRSLQSNSKQQKPIAQEFICSNKWQFNGENLLISFPVLFFFFSFIVWRISLFLKSDLAVTWFHYISCYNLSHASEANVRKKIQFAGSSSKSYNYPRSVSISAMSIVIDWNEIAF